MNVKKLVAKNAIRAGAPKALAEELGAKFARYHKDQKIADKEVKAFDFRTGGQPSKKSSQAERSRDELVAFVKSGPNISWPVSKKPGERAPEIERGVKLGVGRVVEEKGTGKPMEMWTAAEIVYATGKQVEQSSRNGATLAIAWTGTSVLVAYCAKRAVDVFGKVSESFKGILASAPLPDRAKFWTAVVGGIVGFAATSIIAYLLHRTKKRMELMAVDLQQIAREAKKIGETF